MTEKMILVKPKKRPDEMSEDELDEFAKQLFDAMSSARKPKPDAPA